MGSHSRKRSSPKSSKQPSLSSLEVSAATGVPANLDSSPQSSDGRPTTHRIDTHGSVQALVVDNDIVIAGLQDGRLAGWSLLDYKQLFTLKAHDDSVLALLISDDGELLFSSGADSVVKVYSLRSFNELASFHSLYEIGDIFCLAYSSKAKTLFTGSQNGAIQYTALEEGDVEEQLVSLSLGSAKHRFFDSQGPGGAMRKTLGPKRPNAAEKTKSGRDRFFPSQTYQPYAHTSYVYSMLLVQGLFNGDEEREVLVTGGGDGAIKVWDFHDQKSRRLKQVIEFENDGSNVLSLTFGGLFLFAGLSDGLVHVYNLASGQLVQKLNVGTVDVSSIQVLEGMALVGTSMGQVKHFSTQFTEKESWIANQGKILATSLARSPTKDLFLTAGNDGTIAVWDVSDMFDPATPMTPHGNDDMIQALRELVSYRSVAANSKYTADCHEAVGFLRKLFNLFDAKNISLLPTGDGINPILLARFNASQKPEKCKTILFYGHYDIVDAEESPGWSSDPFRLHPQDGYLYGRGVTDNKAPILAAMFAAAELVKSETLGCNVVFLLEGEEEAGSRGFTSVINTNKDKIGDVDYCLLSNSTWLDDHIPCLTYGMRGVVHFSVTVTSGRAEQHSGMDGKRSQHEPLKDLTALLAELSGPTARGIEVPNFLQAIKVTNTKWEDAQYEYIANTLMQGHPEIKSKDAFIASLEHRWQQPNLTVHQISVPDSKTAVTISGSAQATFSIRIVPDQTADSVALATSDFLQHSFEKIGGRNKLEIKITSMADPWLADPEQEPFNTFKSAIVDVWYPQEDSTALRSFPAISSSRDPAVAPNFRQNRPTHRRASSLATRGFFNVDNTARGPLFIREGGSIPALRILEKEFKAKAVMFPMGQASDNAHLFQERMRVENLYKGKEVLKKVFSEL